MSYPILWKPAYSGYRTQGRSEPVRALVNHRMVGTLAGTTAWFQNPDHRPVSTHFGVGKINGRIEIHQYVYLDDTAYGNGNYSSTGRWDNWGYKTTEINAQTISIEHQDHWGLSAMKGIVPDDVQAASIWLQALILRADTTEWSRHNLRLRSTRNMATLARELWAIPINGRHIITHHDIAGDLKPTCWLPWAEDNVGFPRTKYVNGIQALIANAPTPANEEDPMLRFRILRPAPGVVTIPNGRGIVNLADGTTKTDLPTQTFETVARIGLYEPLGDGDGRQTGWLFGFEGDIYIALDDVVGSGFEPTAVPTVDPNPELQAELIEVKAELAEILADLRTIIAEAA